MSNLKPHDKVYLRDEPDVIGEVLKVGIKAEWADVQLTLPNGQSWRKKYTDLSKLVKVSRKYIVTIDNVPTSPIELNDEELRILERVAKNINKSMGLLVWGPELTITELK